MKSTGIKLVILLVFLAMSSGLFAQSIKKDATETKPKVYPEYRANSFDELQRYFLKEENKFQMSKIPIGLYSVMHELKLEPDPEPKYFRLSGDYSFRLNTLNFGISYSPSLFKKDSPWRFYIGPRVGIGTNECDFLYKDEDLGTHAKIHSMVGLETELEFSLVENVFGLYGGIGYSFLSIEKYQDNEGNNGTAIDLFMGPRLTFFGKSNNTKVSLSARLGWLYTNSIEHFDGSAYYYGLGANITSLQTMSKKSSLQFMKLESGFFYSPPAGVFFGQLTQPIRLLPNVSVGINGQVGTGTHESINNDERVNSYWGIGADLRLFGNVTSAFVNPYFGYTYQSYGYQDTTGHKRNGLNMIRVGNRIRLGKNSNWYIDANAGAPINNPDVFVTLNTQNKKSPVLFDFNIGLIYKIRAIEEKNIGAFIGQIEIYDEKDIHKIPVKGIDPLSPFEAADEVIEKRYYVKASQDTAIREVMPNIDVSDIKVLRFDYITNSSVKMSKDFFKIKNQPQDTLVLLVAMFDKNRNDISKFDNNNIYLVFSDLKESRYFGFKYDRNQRIQPETRTGNPRILGTGDDRDFYGNFQEYVKNLRWLDSDTLALKINKIDGKEVERDILRYFSDFNDQIKENLKSGDEPFEVTKENYRFAYAIYPNETIKGVKQSCKNSGISLMFKYDLNGNNTADSIPVGYIKNKNGQFEIDNNDATFFSNAIAGFDNLYAIAANENDPTSTDKCSQNITIDNFGLGKDKISPENMEKLARAGVLQHRCNRVVVIEGYTDKVEFTKNANIIEKLIAVKNNEIVNKCESLKEHRNYLIREWNEKQSNEPPDDLLQRTLAWFRILSALTELDKLGADITNAVAEPVGIFKDPEYDYESYNSAARKVEIHFE